MKINIREITSLIFMDNIILSKVDILTISVRI